MKRLLCILTVLATASCVYPFNPEIADATDHSLVVSGDILIGELSTFTLGYTFPLSAVQSEMRADYPKGAKVWVEDNSGRKYSASLSGKTKYLVDLTSADPSLQYRLHVGLEEGTYETGWLDVQEAPQITGFRYSADETDVKLLLSLDGGEKTRWFRWDWVETWEYHADFVPTLMFVSGVDEKDLMNPSKIYREPDASEDYYYCWSSGTSVECGLASTDGQSTNKVIDNYFHTIARSSKKLSEVYRIDIVARGVTRPCYGYWNNLAAISNNTGSLFSPTPSEVRGNIYNIEDSSEMVYGYVEATRTSTARFHIRQDEAHLYRINYNAESLKFIPEADEDGVIDFEYFYRAGYAPVTTTDDHVPPTITNVNWAPKRCTDCRVEGGSKARPADWPNTHK